MRVKYVWKIEKMAKWKKYMMSEQIENKDNKNYIYIYINEMLEKRDVKKIRIRYIKTRSYMS